MSFFYAGSKRNRTDVLSGLQHRAQSGLYRRGHGLRAAERAAPGAPDAGGGGVSLVLRIKKPKQLSEASRVSGGFTTNQKVPEILRILPSVFFAVPLGTELSWNVERRGTVLTFCFHDKIASDLHRILG